MNPPPNIKRRLRRGLRAAFLESAYQSHVALNALLASLGDFQASIRECREPSGILGIARVYICRLIDFRATAFFLVDRADSSFRLIHCEPASEQGALQRMVDREIETGTFGWVLKQHRAVIVRPASSAQHLILHAMETRTRLIGMFAGLLERGERPTTDLPLSLLSMILANAASTMENLDLYKELNDYSQNLEHLVERRTKELERANDELIKTKKLESVGLLAGGIAHDFNNMLTVILGNITLAQRNLNRSAKISRRLETAEQACRRASGLTHQLLTFAKGGAPMKNVTAIGKLIQEVVSLTMAGSKLTHEVSIPSNLHPVEIDEGQIHQVMMNLIINAEDAMTSGGTIRIRAENVVHGGNGGVPLQAGNYVRIVVQDEGPGIPREDFQKIFDPYFSTKPGRSGLGLAINHSIIQKHDGHIAVESELGKGTTFSIYLPAARKGRKAQHRLDQEMGWDDASRVGKRRILIMDDEEAVRTLAADILGDVGHDTACAADGSEALEMYRRARADGRSYDLVIMDLTVVGGLGGKEALRELRQLDQKVPVLVSSGYSDDPIMGNFRKFGFQGVVAKPYRFNDLNHAVNETLSGKTSRRLSRSASAKSPSAHSGQAETPNRSAPTAKNTRVERPPRPA